MLTLTRKDMLLTINDNVIPAMGSSDVPVKFVNDTETYQGFLIEPRVGYYVNGCPKSLVCEYSSNTIKIPAEAFKQRGVLVIAIALIDNNDSNHIEVTKELALEVTPAPNGTVILPATDTWQTAVKNLVEQLYNQDYKPLYDKALEDINKAVKTANTASSDATTALDTANQTNELINQKIQDGSFIPNITVGEVTTGAAGTEANVEITGTKQEPVLNFTIPKGQDGSGQTTVMKNDTVISTLRICSKQVTISNADLEEKNNFKYAIIDMSNEQNEGIWKYNTFTLGAIYYRNFGVTGSSEQFFAEPIFNNGLLESVYLKISDYDSYNNYDLIMTVYWISIE